MARPPSAPPAAGPPVGAKILPPPVGAKILPPPAGGRAAAARGLPVPLLTGLERVGGRALPGNGGHISHADCAIAVLDQIERPTGHRTRIGVHAWTPAAASPPRRLRCPISRQADQPPVRSGTAVAPAGPAPVSTLVIHTSA
ncbi:hypothetical protein UK12_12175 [Saccharothrix sp. ST-888]|nr:hypothetical protein UK12_12175 [Saccharothrix sp. ST-888]